MEFTLKNFIESGAVRHICYYAGTECGEPIDWAKVREYIDREFRDATEVQRNVLYHHCVKVQQAAEAANLEAGF